MCPISAAIAHISIGCSVFTLASIAVVRYIVICCSLKFSNTVFKPRFLTFGFLSFGSYQFLF
ncbi:hypothetical protein HOLleu_11956 [Holothuria leucospilota]|uniref:G-protein coupled receptors family 1 profile domain-containing protein n=1 Tax=Holothuria leucospilota TaxID=206669 RepID=A0A9Q1CAN1_HOLLE|nr:hypothetical protein HOLleu_11956 [Holothuria leucospilota]